MRPDDPIIPPISFGNEVLAYELDAEVRRLLAILVELGPIASAHAATSNISAEAKGFYASLFMLPSTLAVLLLAPTAEERNAAVAKLGETRVTVDGLVKFGRGIAPLLKLESELQPRPDWLDSVLELIKIS